MFQSKILGSGSVLRPQSISTAELVSYAGLEKFGCEPEIIAKTMGITHVRHCEETVRPGELATEAAMKAMTNAGIAPADLGMVIYCGIEGDGTEPATAHSVADQLGIDSANFPFCFDCSNACHGFTTGLQIARTFIASEIHNIDYALICTGERSSGKTKVICDDFRSGKIGKAQIAETLGAFSVGDAGGAMVIGRSNDGKGIVHSSSSNKSSLAQLCHFTNFGLDRGIQPTYTMKMGKICAKTKKIVQQMVPEALDHLKWRPEEIDHGIFHQVGRRVHNDWTEILGIDRQKAPSTYEKWGNLASANLPVIWDSLAKNNQLREDQKVFIISAGSGVVVSMVGIAL